MHAFATQQVVTFLMFSGKAEEAINLYTSLFARSEIIKIERYEAGGPGAEGTVQQALFSLNDQIFMAADAPVKHDFGFTPATSLFVCCETEEEVHDLFEKLSKDGQVLMPLDKYPFSEKFCWITDKYGVSWQLSKTLAPHKRPPESPEPPRPSFERFTEKAIKTVFLAQEEVRRIGLNFVGAEQLLLGLIGEGTGIAARTLKSVGVNLRDARVEVEKIVGRGSGFVATELPFTPRCKRVMELSWTEAQKLGHNYIGTEHLLLGLIREGDGVAVRVLENFGVDLQELRAKVIEAISAWEGAHVNVALGQRAPLTPPPSFLSFTEKAIKTVLLAQEESRRLGHNFVGTEQLLLGLIGEGTGIAARTIKSAGVSLKDVRVEVEKIIGRGKGYAAVEMPFTPRVKRVMELAWTEARDLGHNYIGTEHLLLGLIREGDGVAVRILVNFGVDLQELRSKVIETLSNQTREGARAEDDANPGQRAPEVHPAPRPSFSRFTEKAIKTVLLAQEEARRLGHNFVGTEQLLLGLIGEGTGIAARTLKSAGVNLRDARVEVEKIIGRGSGFVAVEIPFTPRSKRVMELSWTEAQELGHDYIGTEHLLLGLILEGDGVAVRVLEKLGVDLQKLRIAVIEAMAK